MHAYTDTRMYCTTPKHKVYNSIYWCSRGAEVVKTVYKNLKTISSNETKQWKKDCVALTTEVDLVMSQVSNEDDKFLTTMRCYIKTPLDHVTHVRQTTSSFTVRLEPVPGWSVMSQVLRGRWSCRVSGSLARHSVLHIRQCMRRSRPAWNPWPCSAPSRQPSWLFLIRRASSPCPWWPCRSGQSRSAAWNTQGNGTK